MSRHTYTHSRLSVGRGGMRFSGVNSQDFACATIDIVQRFVRCFRVQSELGVRTLWLLSDCVVSMQRDKGAHFQTVSPRKAFTVLHEKRQQQKSALREVQILPTFTTLHN